MNVCMYVYVCMYYVCMYVCRSVQFFCELQSSGGAQGRLLLPLAAAAHALCTPVHHCRYPRARAMLVRTTYTRPAALACVQVVRIIIVPVAHVYVGVWHPREASNHRRHHHHHHHHHHRHRSHRGACCAMNRHLPRSSSSSHGMES